MARGEAAAACDPVRLERRDRGAEFIDAGQGARRRRRHARRGPARPSSSSAAPASCTAGASAFSRLEQRALVVAGAAAPARRPHRPPLARRDGVRKPRRVGCRRGHEIEARGRRAAARRVLSDRHGWSIAPAIGRFGGVCKPATLQEGKGVRAVHLDRSGQAEALHQPAPLLDLGLDVALQCRDRWLSIGIRPRPMPRSCSPPGSR